MKSFKLLVLFPFLMSFGLHAQNKETVCTYSLKKEEIKIKWEAFKTPSKTGVEGLFLKTDTKGETQGKSIIEIVKGLKLEIDTASTSTKDPARDQKIVKFFFSDLNGGSLIKTETKNVTEEAVEVEISMNGVSYTVPMSYTFQNGNFRASGVLDIMDFQMGKQLTALNDACKVLHKGKTWSDVNLEVFAKFSKKCE